MSGFSRFGMLATAAALAMSGLAAPASVDSMPHRPAAPKQKRGHYRRGFYDQSKRPGVKRHGVYDGRMWRP